MSERSLASIRRISKISPIEGADRIVLATVDGWSLITAKENGFKEGDLVCYFEPDSFLPVDPRWEFLRSKCFKSTKNLGDGFRLRTMKMRGQISQGLIVPLNDLAELEGFNLSEMLKVQKYEKPIPANLAGKVRGNFPSWIRKTDQERAQNLLPAIREALCNDELFEVSLKLDGSSMTLYVDALAADEPEARVGVCSRNWDLDEEEETGTRRNSFWQCVRDSGWIEKMKSAHSLLEETFAIQGELMGEGVQHNREGLKGLHFYVYHVWDIAKQCYLLPEARHDFLFTYIKSDFNHVPIIALNLPLKKIAREEYLMEDLLTFANRPSLNNPVAEGVVFKSLYRDFQFKVINNEFLLKEKD